MRFISENVISFSMGKMKNSRFIYVIFFKIVTYINFLK